MSESSHSSLGRVHTVNDGSSSIKFALFEASDPPRRIHRGTIERVDPRKTGSEWIDILERDLWWVGPLGNRLWLGGECRERSIAFGLHGLPSNGSRDSHR
jgi:hypothetical protein